MKILFYVNDLIAAGVVRGDVLARAINQNTEHTAICKSELLLSDALWPDVVVFQRSCRPADIAFAKNLTARKIPFIYDIDDDLYNVPTVINGAHEFYSLPETQAGMTEMMNLARTVVTSTDELHRIVPRGKQVFTIRNCIDTGHSRLAKPLQNFEGITIMWHGSETHLQDIGVVRDPLVQVLREWRGRARMLFVGHFTPENVGPEFAGLPVDYHGWFSPMELYSGLATADIGLCPLIDTPFNRAKSEIKWLEYGAVGVPVVVPDLPPYERVVDFHNGMKARTESEWYAAINRLVSDGQLRARIGNQARVNVHEYYSSADRIKEWVGLVGSLA